MMQQSLKTAPENYNAVAKWLHWSIAALIITNYIIGLTLDSTDWYTFHEQNGLTILLLVLLRIIWRLSSSFPMNLPTISAAENLAAKSGQGMLYLLMLIIPISGVLLVEAHGYPLALWGLWQIPLLLAKQPHAVGHLIKEWHLWLAHSIIIIATGHALIAIYHHVISKNRLLLRMLPNFKK